jgi:hypothetical protein
MPGKRLAKSLGSPSLYLMLITGRPIQDFAKSSLKVAEFNLRTNGDLLLAQEYLKIVAASNVEDVVRAAELLKAVTYAVHKRTAAEAEGQPKGTLV